MNEYHITKGTEGEPVITHGDDADVIATGREEIETLLATLILALKATR